MTLANSVLVLKLVAGVGLLVFLIFLLVSNITSSLAGSPFIPIARRYVKKILAFGGLGANRNIVFFDLGCGDGRFLVSAIRDFGARKAVGYEIAPWPYLKAKMAIRALVPLKAEVVKANLLEADLSQADLIFCYLYSGLVDRLAAKIARECRSGTRVLSASFPINLQAHSGFRLLKSEKIGKITAYLYEKV